MHVLEFLTDPDPAATTKHIRMLAEYYGKPVVASGTVPWEPGRLIVTLVTSREADALHARASALDLFAGDDL